MTAGVQTCRIWCRIAGAVVALVAFLLLRDVPLGLLLSLVLAAALGVVVTWVAEAAFCSAKDAAEDEPADTPRAGAEAGAAVTPETSGRVECPSPERDAARPGDWSPQDGAVAGIAGTAAAGASSSAAESAETVPQTPAPAETAAPETNEAAALVAAGDPGEKPVGLDAARDGAEPDLTRINGIGPKLAQALNDLGFYHVDQIASWSAKQIAWVDQNLPGFRGRALRDDWVGQARRLRNDDRAAKDGAE